VSRIESKRPSRLLYALALLALGIVVVVVWSADESVEMIAGVEAPTFEAVTMEGEPVSLEEYSGDVVLLNIWATGCAPCLQELPSMQRLHERIPDEDFHILAVSVDGLDEQRVCGFVGGDVPMWVERLGLTFDILRDPSGAICETFDTTGLPESFLIGRNGRIYKRLAGATEWDADSYAEQIRRLLDA
jgi:peroxiredoxin